MLDRSLIISVISGVLPLSAAIVNAKGPKKYKNIYINILFLTIGLTLGLFIMYLINQTADPVKTEILGPTPIQVGKPIHTADNLVIDYKGWIQGVDFLTITSGEKSAHIQMAITGEECKFQLNNKSYIMKLVLAGTINDGEIVIQMYRT